MDSAKLAGLAVETPPTRGTGGVELAPSDKFTTAELPPIIRTGAEVCSLLLFAIISMVYVVTAVGVATVVVVVVVVVLVYRFFKRFGHVALSIFTLGSKFNLIRL